MRVLRHFVFVMATGLAAACGGDTPTGPDPGRTLTGSSISVTQLRRGSMTATVDGSTVSAALVSGSIGTVSGTPPVVIISASSNAGMFISLSGPLAVGTHIVGDPTTFVDFSLSQGLGVFWRANVITSGSSGTVTLTAASPTRVAGTFSFTAVASGPGTIPATRTVTDGRFEVLP